LIHAGGLLAHDPEKEEPVFPYGKRLKTRSRRDHAQGRQSTVAIEASAKGPKWPVSRF
jgi:hypothetical protein